MNTTQQFKPKNYDPVTKCPGYEMSEVRNVRVPNVRLRTVRARNVRVRNIHPPQKEACLDISARNVGMFDDKSILYGRIFNLTSNFYIKMPLKSAYLTNEREKRENTMNVLLMKNTVHLHL